MVFYGFDSTVVRIGDNTNGETSIANNKYP